MLLRSKLILATLFLVSCASPPQADATELSEQADANDLKAVVGRFSDAVTSRNFSALQSLMLSNEFTFDSDGNIDPGIACFLQWEETCQFDNSHVADILAGNYFVYYYHLDDDNVIASFIREEEREKFCVDPSKFLEDNYLSKYFSCQIVRRNGRWLLKESLCFSETEGPFVPQPEV